MPVDANALLAAVDAARSTAFPLRPLNLVPCEEGEPLIEVEPPPPGHG